ncbi:MAG: TetR/AcrR family transcriptional regulator [Nocardioides sp.]|uniref:TetR/AcrR family transcriptional regulator n=1 Tax=Nocardioides sp. TaxID=35761 RepID=UPI003F124D36
MTRMKADERRERLLQAAEELMTREGVAAGTTRAIVAEAGMQPSVFHYCFRSRDEMVNELIARLGSRVRQAVWEGVVPSTDLREMLLSAVDAYLDYLTASPEVEQVGFELNHWALRAGHPEVAAQQYAAYYDVASHVLSLAAEATGQRWALPLPIMARMAITMMDGVTTTWLADRDTEASRTVLAQMLDHVAGLAVPITEE